MKEMWEIILLLDAKDTHLLILKLSDNVAEYYFKEMQYFDNELYVTLKSLVLLKK